MGIATGINRGGGPAGREYVMAGLPLVGDEFAGYRVRSVLGRGGMSVVYQAENLRLSSIIALKILAPELAPTTHSGPGSWRSRGSRPR